MSFSAEDIKNAQKRVVGTKQTLKALQNDEVLAVFIAEDAEEKVVAPLIGVCSEKGIDWSYAGKMVEIGRLVGIKVGAASVAIVK